MSTKLLLLILFGVPATCIPTIVMAPRYRIPWWKAAVILLLLLPTGIAGVYGMFYIENGIFGGISFYGAVFLLPLVFLPVAWLLRLPYGQTLDLCTVAGSLVLPLMKINCIIGKCCIGRVLFTLTDGTQIRFPSREVEMVVALCLFVLLFRWGLRGKNRGSLYPWFLVLYGSTRFVLNIFREAWVTRTMLLPFGNIWSLVAMAIGTVWLLVTRQSRDGRGL